MKNNLFTFPSKEILNNLGDNFYIVPQGIFSTSENFVNSSLALPISYDNNYFSALKLIVFHKNKYYSYFFSVYQFLDWIQSQEKSISILFNKQIKNFNKSNKKFCGYELNKPIIMGILNVTPDSFSDGGKYNNLETALSYSLKMLENGASIIDVGGESTRPGASPVDPTIEQQRVLPIIKSLCERGITVSVDTMHASTMDLALKSGAKIVNDVSALLYDKEALGIVRENSANVILMHMQKNPATMQAAPKYDNAPVEIFNFLKKRVDDCVSKGIDKNMISIDPGIGFGKLFSHNLEIIKDIMIFHMMGLPLLVGVSRKSFIGKLINQPNPENRTLGSVVLNFISAVKGVNILRVHDVDETHQAMKAIDLF